MLSFDWANVKHDLKMELFMRNCNLISSLMIGLM